VPPGVPVKDRYRQVDAAKSMVSGREELGRKTATMSALLRSA